MAENIDELKGRAKRAGGELTNDDRLKREGSVDKAAGKAKALIDEAAKKTTNVVGRGTKK